MGSLWGIFEATLGHALHFLPYGFSGMFMMPIGFYFMYNAYKKNEKRSTVISVGILAATIKLVDLLLPGRSPMGVINPAASIILESLLVFVFIKAMDRKQVFKPAFLLGILWISAFTLSQALIFRPASGLYLEPIFTIMIFIALNAIVSATLITLYLKKSELSIWKLELKRTSFALPAATLLIALTLELINSVVL